MRRPLPVARLLRLEAERVARKSEAAKVRAARRCFIYFLGCEGFIKIGFGHDPVQRCSAAQVGNPFPVSLAAVALGGEKEERILHGAFRDLHVRAEWFRNAAPLSGLVAEMADATPRAARWILGEWLFSHNGSRALLISQPHNNGHMDQRCDESPQPIVSTNSIAYAE